MTYPKLFCLLSAMFISNASILAIDEFDTLNMQPAELKKAMQEDPQFEKDFMHRVRIGGKAALYDTARLSCIGAAIGTTTGALSSAIGITLGKALVYGINRFRTPSNRIIAAKVSHILPLLIGTSAVSIAASFGGIGAYNSLDSGCTSCGRDMLFPSLPLGSSYHDETIPHDQPEMLKANREASNWVRNHKWLTLSTLISDKPAYNALYADRVQE